MSHCLLCDCDPRLSPVPVLIALNVAMPEKCLETFPPAKLGEYKVISEIAEGTFGKVKSQCIRPCTTVFVLTRPIVDSGRPYNNRSESCDEVPVEGHDQCY